MLAAMQSKQRRSRWHVPCLGLLFNCFFKGLMSGGTVGCSAVALCRGQRTSTVPQPTDYIFTLQETILCYNNPAYLYKLCLVPTQSMVQAHTLCFIRGREGLVLPVWLLSPQTYQCLRADLQTSLQQFSVFVSSIRITAQ